MCRREKHCAGWSCIMTMLLREIVLASRYEPHDESYRALFYFLTDQWNAYEQLDFDHQLLRIVYETADRSLRNRIAARARQAGRLEWVNLVAGGKQGKRLALMTEAEWKAALAVLANGQRTKDLWRLAQEAPPRWSAQILAGLKKARDLVREDEQGAFEELIRLAKQWEDRDFSPYFHHRLTLEGHPHQIRCMAFTASGKILASGGADHTIRLWRLADGHLLKTLEGHVQLGQRLDTYAERPNAGQHRKRWPAVPVAASQRAADCSN